jgi:hypothetical protein
VKVLDLRKFKVNPRKIAVYDLRRILQTSFKMDTDFAISKSDFRAFVADRVGKLSDRAIKEVMDELGIKDKRIMSNGRREFYWVGIRPSGIIKPNIEIDTDKLDLLFNSQYGTQAKVLWNHFSNFAQKNFYPGLDYRSSKSRVFHGFENFLNVDIERYLDKEVFGEMIHVLGYIESECGSQWMGFYFL